MKNAWMTLLGWCHILKSSLMSCNKTQGRKDGTPSNDQVTVPEKIRMIRKARKARFPDPSLIKKQKQATIVGLDGEVQVLAIMGGP